MKAINMSNLRSNLSAERWYLLNISKVDLKKEAEQLKVDFNQPKEKVVDDCIEALKKITPEL